MALIDIDIDIPADDGWEDSLAARILLIASAALIIQTGFRIWVTLRPGADFVAAAVVLLYTTGITMLLLSLTDWDMRRWGRWVAAGAILAVLVAFLGVLAKAEYIPALGTDAMIFSAYSADLIIQGQNPYTTSMVSGFDLPGADGQFATPRVDGSMVLSVSYPAGSFLAYIPQKVLVGRAGIGLRLTTMLAVGALGLFLVSQSPPELAIGAVPMLFGARNMVKTAAGGVFDVLWILPVVVAMSYWHRERFGSAGIALGLAATVKQIPWILGPFLLIWLVLGADDTADAVSRVGRCGLGAVGAFGLVNAPFIAAAPGAWLQGVVTPVAGDAALVHQGVGLTLFSVVGTVQTSVAWHTQAVATVTVLALVAYVLWFDRLKWAAWVMPPLVLFVHYRSLNSYFISFLPVAYFGAICLWDRRQPAAVRPWLQARTEEVKRWTAG